MSNKSKKRSIPSFLKWILYAVCAVLGLKAFIVVFSFISTGVALATLALWGLGACLVGGLVLFTGYKLLGSKKK
jgi:Na+/proline symporter